MAKPKQFEVRAISARVFREESRFNRPHQVWFKANSSEYAEKGDVGAVPRRYARSKEVQVA